MNGSLNDQAPVLEQEADKKVREWSIERYQEFQENLFKFTKAEQISLQEQALITVMNLLKAEGQHPLQKLPEGKEHMFPLDLLEVCNYEFKCMYIHLISIVIFTFRNLS